MIAFRENPRSRSGRICTLGTGHDFFGLANRLPRGRGTPKHAQKTQGFASGPEEKADQPPHDAVDIPIDGWDQLAALPGRSGWSHLDEGGPEEDCILLLSRGQSDLRGPVSEGNIKVFKKVQVPEKIVLVVMEKC